MFWDLERRAIKSTLVERKFYPKKGKTVLGRKNISTKVKNTKNLDYPKNGEAFGVARVSLMRNEERGVEYDQES